MRAAGPAHNQLRRSPSAVRKIGCRRAPHRRYKRQPDRYPYRLPASPSVTLSSTSCRDPDGRDPLSEAMDSLPADRLTPIRIVKRRGVPRTGCPARDLRTSLVVGRPSSEYSADNVVNIRVKAAAMAEHNALRLPRKERSRYVPPMTAADILQATKC